MIVDRSIKRPFLGSWTVTVRRWGAEGWVTYCTARGASHYRAGSELPRALTLDWWTDGRCPVLGEGRYTVGTVWEINPLISYLPRKVVQAESNIFEVTP
jgi:hypothetical protein